MTRNKTRLFELCQRWNWLLLAIAVNAQWMYADADGQVDRVPDRRNPRPVQFFSPCIIEFHGDIDWQLSQYFRMKIAEAKSAGHDLIIVDIDSPGGLKSESLNLAELIRNIDWAYTVAFVPREALSGAALVSFGCDELLIGELARFGDIGVIQYDPQLFAFRFAPEKIQSVLIRQARDLAASKGHSPELAEAMIDKEFRVYYREREGEVEFFGRHANQAEPPEGWKIIEETEKGFLTVNGVRAKRFGLASEFAEDRDQLANRLGFELRDARVIRRNFKDSVVYWLNHPLATGLLILIGLIAMFTELSVPGTGVGGLIAGLCALLFFWSRVLGGTSTWLEVLLFAAGIVFIMMELFVIPGWGISGLLGVLMTIGSVFMASQDFVMPSTARQWNQFLTSLLILLCSGTLFLVAAGFIVRHFGSIPVFNKLMLAPPETESVVDEAGTKIATTGKKAGHVSHPPISAGDWGEAASFLRPAGRAIFAGRSFDVVSDGEFIEAGSQVKVLSIQGNRIVVSAIADPEVDGRPSAEQRENN